MMAARMTRLPRLVCASFLLWCAYLVSSAPVTARTPDLSRIAAIDGPADLVQVDGTVLYVVADRTLRIVDITNPSVPKAAGAFTFPEHIRSFAVSGSSVYVLADFHGIRILDVSNPASPVLRGSLPLKGGYFTIVLFDKNVLLASGILAGLQIIDVSDVAKPAPLASYFTDGYAQSISVSRPLAYVIDAPTGLYVFDLSNPRSPAVVTVLKLNAPQQQSPGAITTGSVAISEAVAGRSPETAVLLDSTNSLLLFYDVSRLAAPVRISSFSVPAGSEALVVRGSMAYIASGRQGLQIVDFSNPIKPVDSGTFKTMQPAHDVAVADSVVFVATGSGGVIIFRSSQ